MTSILNEQVLAQLFTEARTYSAWQNKAVSDETLYTLYHLVKFGPTSANTEPARFVFIKSPEAKSRLEPLLDPGNKLKTMAAPVTVIVAYDKQFYEHLPRLFPHTDAKSWFVGNEVAADKTAFRNSALQGAYLILAARALGLDCGPMSGFDESKLNKVFFPEGRYCANFLINIGYGDKSTLHPRNPRLDFDIACAIQ